MTIVERYDANNLKLTEDFNSLGELTHLSFKASVNFFLQTEKSSNNSFIVVIANQLQYKQKNRDAIKIDVHILNREIILLALCVIRCYSMND